MLSNIFKTKRAFTLIETLVGVTVFLVIATSIYQAYVSLFSFISLNQYKVLALNLANEQFEIIRNLSYSNIGIPGAIPNGQIPHIQTLERGGVNFTVTTTIRNVDLPFDGLIGETPNDLSPADNKLVSVEITCATCRNFTPINITTTVAPKNLETASTNGSLLVKVFDANGLPVNNASVSIINNLATPPIVINDVTNVNGFLQIVDAPPGAEAYEIIVTKAGYSTDKTYPTGGVANPNPIKTHATVLLQQLTQISLSIDKLSSLTIKSENSACTSIPNVGLSLKGTKLIGTDVIKYYSTPNTGGTGTYINNSMEWDYYNIVSLDSVYDIAGINPLNAISLGPNNTQSISVVMTPKNPKSLLVTVKDSSTLLPITDAIVRVTNSGSYDNSKITGRGSISQTDWSGGEYSSNDGNIDVLNPAGELTLRNVFGSYNPSGVMESIIFDTGSASNFHNLAWLPTDQPIEAGANSVRFQFATNATSTASTTWDYKGPDETSSTYYTLPNTTLSSVHNGDRYAKFKVFLETLSSTSTPNISDISFTVTTSCTPPGQVIFTGLSSDSYHVEVNKAGYTISETDVNVNLDWQEHEIILAP
jgi:prepilin-type N-terminal cleavage/methylation domain-containing protein